MRDLQNLLDVFFLCISKSCSQNDESDLILLQIKPIYLSTRFFVFFIGDH